MFLVDIFVVVVSTAAVFVLDAAVVLVVAATAVAVLFLLFLSLIRWFNLLHVRSLLGLYIKPQRK